MKFLLIVAVLSLGLALHSVCHAELVFEEDAKLAPAKVAPEVYEAEEGDGGEDEEETVSALAPMVAPEPAVSAMTYEEELEFRAVEREATRKALRALLDAETRGVEL